jgi:DNA-directed RNA polymerase subunit RPC12/RpoP
MSSNKLVFTCNACGAEGTIKLDQDHEISVCPHCGNSLDVEDEFDVDEDE